MNSKLALVVVCMLLLKITFAQTNSHTSARTVVDLVTKQILQTVALDEQNSFSLKPLPDTVVIRYNDNTYTKSRIVLYNKGASDSISIGFPSSGKNTINLQLKDFDQGTLILSFAANQLLSIGHPDKPMKPMSLDKWQVWLKIDSTEKDATSKANTSENFNCTKKITGKQSILDCKPLDVATVTQCILCSKFPSCDDKVHGSPAGIDKEGFKHSNGFLGKKRNFDSMYIGVYDIKSGAEWYKNSITAKNRIYNKNKIKLNSLSELSIYIKGSTDDEDYVLTADGTTYFMDDVSLLSKAFTGNETTDTSSGDNENSLGINTDGKTLAQLAPYALKINSEKDSNLKGVTIGRDSIILNAKSSPLIFTKQFPGDKKDSTIKNFYHTLDSLFRVSTIKPTETLINEKMIWKAKFIALDEILEHFNDTYGNIDFKDANYQRDLSQIKQGINKCLGISANQNPDYLKSGLEIIRCSVVDDANLQESELLINAIVTEYKAAISKTTNRKLFVKQIEVPDADEVKITVTSKKNNTALLNRTFRIKGGWKIDFSTGVFYNGLGIADYGLSQSSFKYLETRDSFFISNGIQVDSVRYTGRVIDTSGVFIKKNSNRINYGAGVFVNIYPRTGGAFDVGIGFGFQVNTSGQSLLMIGLSPMIHAGKNRVCLIAGLAAGKRTYLSESAKPYVYQPYYQQYDQASNSQGVTVFNNKNNLPRFYPTGSDLKAATYDKIGFGFFAGLTFNFASFSLGK